MNQEEIGQREDLGFQYPGFNKDMDYLKKEISAMVLDGCSEDANELFNLGMYEMVFRERTYLKDIYERCKEMPKPKGISKEKYDKCSEIINQFLGTLEGMIIKSNKLLCNWPEKNLQEIADRFKEIYAHQLTQTQQQNVGEQGEQ